MKISSHSVDTELYKHVNIIVDSINNNKKISLYTSGTTGAPKNIQKDVECLVGKEQTNQTQKFLLTYSPERWAGVSVILHCLKSGCELIVPNSLLIEDIIAAGKEYGATHISLTPSFFRNMVLRSGACDIHINQITFGGEYATQGVLDMAKQIWPDARVTHVYASTEFGDICAVSDGREGIPEYKFEKFSFDENELIIDGKHTDDLWDKRNGRYYFIGRKQEIINVGGNKVSPIIVEEAANSCGALMSKAYAISSPLMGFVVGLDYVGAITPLQLRKNMISKLPKYAVPCKIVSVEKIELSSAGKLKRTI